jgi:hypothetical protein
LAFGFLRLSAGPKTRNRLCATNSLHLALKEVSVSHVSTAQGGFFSNFATNGGEKADEGNERQPQEKTEKTKREQLFSPTANAFWKRDK